jgi:hypothetical protein
MSMTRIQQRLLAAASRTGETGCWEWRGQISNSGYGRMQVRDAHGAIGMRSAHNLSHEAFIGPVPEGMAVRQTCGNRLCINPDHLELFAVPQSTRRA